MTRGARDESLLLVALAELAEEHFYATGVLRQLDDTRAGLKW